MLEMIVTTTKKRPEKDNQKHTERHGKDKDKLSQKYKARKAIIECREIQAGKWVQRIIFSRRNLSRISRIWLRSNFHVIPRAEIWACFWNSRWNAIWAWCHNEINKHKFMLCWFYLCVLIGQLQNLTNQIAWNHYLQFPFRNEHVS